MIDQFISCAEDKWKLMSGLVLFLPHGYEGQGAEHSSARIERYLQMCAKYNMEVVNCTTPSNFFHLLRRQLKRKYRKPLIVFTPKSLLRHPDCISHLTDLSNDYFQHIIEDNLKKEFVNKLIFCSGKIYYELIEQRNMKQVQNIAIIRTEQLFPLDVKKITDIIDSYNKPQIFWVQEEPLNMGAWTYILSHLKHFNIGVISRSESAATATGSSIKSALQQKEIIEKVFKI